MGYSFSLSIEYSPHTKKKKKTKEKKSIDPVEHFVDIAQDFATILDMLWKYTLYIGGAAVRTSFSNLASLPILIHTLKKKEIERSKSKKAIAKVVFAINPENEKDKKPISALIYDWKDIEKVNDYRKYHDRALRILHESVLQQIVNAWEKILSDLLAWQFKNDPCSIPENQNIKISELLSSKNLDEMKEKVIHNEIKDFLKNNDSKGHLKYLHDELKIDLSSSFPYVAELKEIILRRHAIVHAGGIANAEYCSKLKKIHGYTDKTVDEGTLLKLSPSYIKRAWTVIFSAGVIALHLAAKNHARAIKSKDAENSADDFLVNVSYNNIKNEQYEAAKIILDYADKIRLVTPTSNLMAKVNLAQTCKWLGRHEECSKIISEQDWSACSADFKLCVAALKENKKDFKKFLQFVADEESISLSDLYEWPIFQLMRKCKEFNGWVKNAFGRILDKKDILLTPKLLDFRPDKTMKDLKKYIETLKPKGKTKKPLRKKKLQKNKT